MKKMFIITPALRAYMNKGLKDIEDYLEEIANGEESTNG